MKCDTTAQRFIATSVEEKTMLRIMNCNTLKEMWDKLVSIYEQKSGSSVCMLLQQWYNLAHRLQILGEQIPEQIVVTKILVTLPVAYKYFVRAWESVQASEQTLSNLISRLAIEENGIHSSPNGEALIEEAMFSASDSDTTGEAWYMDSGATDHMSNLTGNQQSWFTTYEEFPEARPVRIGDVKYIPALGSGNTNILAYTGKEWKKKHISKVLYVSELIYNLFSLGVALNKGMTHQSDNRMCKFLNNNSVVKVGERYDKLFKMKFKVVSDSEYCANVAVCEPLFLWHKRISQQNIVQVKQVLSSDNINLLDQKFQCEDCIICKM
ncbi:uncharacterized protein LOC124594783 [Schistocerca americana]|uniref:uncharacterized protein LOC124594783 n=1 Tax=Schistocerca americana TaxID=7009 RepID=UPI001F501809|nr:uncharacterized protein LOC124594783 [Schistocerca americana]